MSVLRLIPKVRQTAAFVVPPSSAVTTAAIFSASIATGRPPRRPRRPGGREASGRKAGTIIATSARAIFEQMPLIDPRGQQRVTLQVHDLPIAIGRNPHVADEHAYGNPRLIGFRRLPHSDKVCRADFDAQSRDDEIEDLWRFDPTLGIDRFGIALPERRSTFVRLCVSEKRFVTSGQYAA